jgi:hypothetical protein
MERTPGKVRWSGAHRDGVVEEGFWVAAFSGEGGAPVAGGARQGALQHGIDEGGEAGPVREDEDVRC